MEQGHADFGAMWTNDYGIHSDRENRTMGMIGSYIDGLTDEERDRIIRGDQWIPGRFFFGGLPACPVAHAVGLDEPGYIESMRNNQDPFRGTMEVYRAFDLAADRFGLSRVVRACKLRAAQGNRVTLPEPVEDAIPETAHA